MLPLEYTHLPQSGPVTVVDTVGKHRVYDSEFAVTSDNIYFCRCDDLGHLKEMPPTDKIKPYSLYVGLSLWSLGGNIISHARI